MAIAYHVPRDRIARIATISAKRLARRQLPIVGGGGGRGGHGWPRIARAHPPASLRALGSSATPVERT